MIEDAKDLMVKSDQNISDEMTVLGPEDFASDGEAADVAGMMAGTSQATARSAKAGSRKKTQSNAEVKSATRALALLELLEKLGRPIRVSEIAKLLRCPQSSASVLVNSLRRLGYLNFNRKTHEFAPSVRVALVGGSISCDGVHAFQILNLLSSVRDKTGLSVILSTRNGIHVQYIYTLPVIGHLMHKLRPGTMRPMTMISPGIALLADSTDSEIGLVVRHLNSLKSNDNIERLDDVLQKVEACRKKGYACTAGTTPGIASLAVKLPFRDSFQQALVVSVAGETEKILEAEADLVKTIREEIEKIGFRADVDRLESEGDSDGE